MMCKGSFLEMQIEFENVSSALSVEENGDETGEGTI